MNKIRQHTYYAANGKEFTDWRKLALDTLAEREELVAMVRMFREEMCWHGNTGSKLSEEMYGHRVDRIDKLLAKLGAE